jgi:chromosomal replication initiator protein
MSDTAPLYPSQDLWQACVDLLAQELPEQQFNTWIRPLAAVVAHDLSRITIQVGNRFKLDWIRAQYGVSARSSGNPFQIFDRAQRL